MNDPTNKTEIENVNLGQRVKKANEAWMSSSERAAMMAGRKGVQT